MNKLKFLLIPFLFFISTISVDALENKTIYGATTGDWYNQTLSQSGKFVYNANTNGGQTVGNVGTTYSDANYGMYFGFYHTVTAGKIYNVKINFNDYDVRHTIDYSYIHINGSACTVQAFQLETTNNSGNAKTINVSFSCPNPSNAVWFSIYKENDGYYYVTTVNWRFNSVQIEEATDGTDNIINNNNMNTQNIINNNNTNTQEIIDNQNQNTQDLINSQKVCEIYDKGDIETDNVYLQGNGNYYESNSYGVTEYIPISKDSEIKMLQVLTNSSAYCYYDGSKTKIICYTNNTTSINQVLTVPTNAKYVRFSIIKGDNKPVVQICKDGNQATTDAIEDLNGSVNNDNVDSSKATETLNNLRNSLPSNGVISDLLLLPVSMLQAIVNSIGGTCSSFSLGTLYETELILPCINIHSYVGDTIWGFIDVFCSALFILGIRKKFVQIFENITNLKNGGNEVE